MIKNNMEDFFEDENEFCKTELEAEKNEHGIYIYESQNKKHSINLPMALRQYRDWLLERRIKKH